MSAWREVLFIFILFLISKALLSDILCRHWHRESVAVVLSLRVLENMLKVIGLFLLIECWKYITGVMCIVIWS